MTLIRPAFLLLLIPLVLFLVWRWRYSPVKSGWQTLIDPDLYQALMQAPKSDASVPKLLLPSALALMIFGLSGPAIETNRGESVTQGNLLIVLDNSLSMAGNDLSPDRLTRAKRMIMDWTDSGIFSQTSIITYSASAHVLTPLTRDRDTLATQLQPLTPFLMPAFGNRADRAFSLLAEKADALNLANSHILWLTDDIDASQLDTISRTLPSVLSRNVVSLGTTAGSPIPLPNNQGFLRDNDGNTVVVRTNAQQIADLGRQLGFRYVPLGTQPNAEFFGQLSRQATDQRSEKDVGYWFLIPAAFLLLWRTRQNTSLALSSLLIMGLLTPDSAYGFELFKNTQQRAFEALQKDPAAVLALTKDPWLTAEALFRQEQFDLAAEQFAQLDAQDALYNRANALAFAGKIEQAIAAYEQALALGEHTNAQKNKQLLEAYLDQQQQQQQQQQDNQSQDENSPAQESQQNDQSPAQEQQAPQNEQTQANNTDEAEDAQPQSEAEDPQTKESTASSEPADEQPLTAEELRQQQEIEAVLNQLQSQPGSVLQQKFQYQHQQNPTNTDEFSW